MRQGLGNLFVKIKQFRGFYKDQVLILFFILYFNFLIF